MALVNKDQIFVATTGTLLSSGTTTALGVGQLGIFDATTYVATTLPVFPTNRAIIIGQGTPDAPLNVGTFQGNSTDKTPVIAAGAVTAWRAKKAEVAQNGIVTMGFDGVDTSKTLTLNAGETKKFWVRLSGTAIDYLMGGTQPYIHEEFTVKADCVENCTDNCDEAVDCNTVLDKVITTVGERKIVGGLSFTDFIKVTPITECTTPSGFATTDCQEWTLTLPDAGDNVALANVQVQYPGITVKRKNREGGISTYSLTVCDESTPAAYISNNGVVIADCTTCPDGYTYTQEAYVKKVTRNSVTQVTTATIAAAYPTGLVAGSVVRVSPSGADHQEFILYSTSASVVPAAGTDFVEIIGTVHDICQGDEDVTTAWVSGEDCTKATGYFQMTLSSPDCTTCAAQLTTLQSIYGDGVRLIDSNTTTCTCKYELPVLSDESCIDCGDQIYTFTTPQPYKGSKWVEVQLDTTGTGCACGVKFESAYVSRARRACYFDQVPYVTEPIFIEVSQFPFDQNDYAALCETDWAITNIQAAKYASGHGAFIADFEKLSKYYFNKPWSSDPAQRDVLGWEFNTDFDLYYDQYVLSFEVAQPLGYQGATQKRFYEWSFYTPTGSGTSFANAINSWLLSTNSTVPPVSI